MCSPSGHANGGHLRKSLRLPNFRKYGVTFDKPGQIEVANTKPLGQFLRDVMKMNMDSFRVFGPDENTSNKLDAIYEVSKKLWLEEYFPEDSDGGELAPDGRVVEMLSEHTLEGMLEGYLLTGRHASDLRLFIADTSNHPEWNTLGFETLKFICAVLIPEDWTVTG